MAEPVIEARALVTELRTAQGVVRPVDAVSLAVLPGQTLAVVGESGCGKTMLAQSLMRLIPPSIGRIAAGQVLIAGRDVTGLNESEMRHVRGVDVAMVFQEPMTSLNPVMTVGAQVAEAITEHEQISRAEVNRRVADLLQGVGIADPRRRMGDYPHQLSGGLRQRAMIALALACRPKALIADEPTTALDVTIQAQVLDLLAQLREEKGLGVLLITHDLGVVAETADSVAVMYAGRKVEHAPAATLFAAPRHPYTRALLACMPNIADFEAARHKPLRTIGGNVPPLAALPKGCAFAPRCTEARPRCLEERPMLERMSHDHEVACFVAQGQA